MPEIPFFYKKLPQVESFAGFVWKSKLKIVLISASKGSSLLKFGSYNTARDVLDTPEQN